MWACLMHEKQDIVQRTENDDIGGLGREVN